jgi:hypothetical protein
MSERTLRLKLLKLLKLAVVVVLPVAVVVGRARITAHRS